MAVYYNLAFGGAKRVVKDQVKGLVEAGDRVDVYTINHEKDLFDPLPFAGRHFNYIFNTPYLGIPLFGRIIHLVNSLIRLRNLNRRIAKDINKRKYDVVLVHPDRFTQAPFILRYLKRISVYYCQEPYRNAYEHSMRIKEDLPLVNKIYEHFFRYLIKVADRNNVKRATYTIASCLHIRERMIEAYEVYPYVVTPGIDTKVFRPLKSVKKGILFVGSKKIDIDGYDLLEKALQLFPSNRKPQIKTVIWKKDNNERISEEELAELYSESSVTACMSKLETFGLIPLESMACGTPVVAINAGGHRETVVNEVNGLLVDHSAEAIFQAINRLVTNQDENVLFSKRAVKHVREKWDLTLKNNELRELLLKITNKR